MSAKKKSADILIESYEPGHSVASFCVAGIYMCRKLGSQSTDTVPNLPLTLVFALRRSIRARGTSGLKLLVCEALTSGY